MHMIWRILTAKGAKKECIAKFNTHAVVDILCFLGRDRIEVARLDGRYRKTLISKRLDEPRAITLYPDKG